MAITIEAQGKTFEFADGTTNEQIGAAIDEYFGASDGKPIAVDAKEPRPQGTEFGGIAETAAAIGSQAPAFIGGGLVGIPVQLAESLGLVEPGTAAQTVESVTDGLTYEPKTQTGQAKLKKFSQGVQNVAESPLVAPVVEGAQTLKSGVQSATGALAEAGAPASAAIAEGVALGLPDMIGVATGGLGVKRGLEAIPQSQRKQSISRRIIEGTGDTDTSIYKTADFDPEDVPAIVDGEKRPPRIKIDPLANNAIKQGFDEGFVAAVKSSGKQDKTKMLQMLDVLKKGMRNKRFKMTNRPSDIAGESMLDRVAVVRDANKAAGKNLDAQANKLKGQEVDFLPPIQEFISNLDDMGIQVSPRKGGVDIDFKGSDIEGLDGIERFVKRVVNRMAVGKSPDAYDVHRLKRYIDAQVTYGKAEEGLSGSIAQNVKSLRAGLDKALDDTFPEYNKVNTEYAETIQLLNNIQDSAGNKLDLSGGNADKALGVKLKGLMSNNQSRINLLDSIEELEAVSRKYGYKSDDDLMNLTMFAQELDKRFKPVAETSFQGQIIQGIEGAMQDTAKGRRSMLDLAIDATTGAARKARGISDDTAIASMEKLLREK